MIKRATRSAPVVANPPFWTEERLRLVLPPPEQLSEFLLMINERNEIPSQTKQTQLKRKLSVNQRDTQPSKRLRYSDICLPVQPRNRWYYRKGNTLGHVIGIIKLVGVNPKTDIQVRTGTTALCYRVSTFMFLMSLVCPANDPTSVFLCIKWKPWEKDLIKRDQGMTLYCGCFCPIRINVSR